MAFKRRLFSIFEVYLKSKPMIKKLFFAMAAALACISVFAQEESKEIVKDGWNFGPLPCVGYNSDLGFQYGICADIFNYKGVFPDYRQRFYVEASRYTKGQTLLHAQFDSRYLIPGVRTTFSLSYQFDPMFNFYGFNGLEDYDKTLDCNKDTRTARYNYRRSMWRAMADFQKPVTDGLEILAGLAFWNYTIGDLEHEDYDASSTLYREMVDAGVFGESEAEGGSILEIKAGARYDTRDNEAAPSRGINAEVYFNGAPDFFGNGYPYLRLAAHFRHYLTLAPDRLVFAYHLAYQGTIAGEAPFYSQQNISTCYLLQTNTDGLGGINSVRGLMPQKLVGSGYAWTNIEFRLRLFSFNLLNQSWYVATNPFFDAGMVTSLYKGEELANYYGRSREELKSEAVKPHCSAGLGLKLAMNRNFIISVEDGIPLNKADGESTLYIALNYIF